MLSIISPAKSLNFEKENKEISHTLPILTDKSQQVVNVLNKLDVKQFMKLMSISENLAQLNVDRIANWKLPFTLKNSKQAVFAFTGDVYVGLNANEFTKDDLSYISGEIYYANWPMIVSKEGNRKMFIDTRWAHPFEQTWMSHIYQLTKEEKIRPAILLASPIWHDRIKYYQPEERREN